ncbi:MAG: ATP-binding protein [Nitrosopumilaceae archaeon]
MKIKYKLLLVFFTLISLLIGFFVIHLDLQDQIEKTTDYHMKMGLPATNILYQIKSNYYAAEAFAFEFTNGLNEEEFEYQEHRSKVFTLINDYSKLTFVTHNDGNFLTPEHMREQMQIYTNSMRETASTSFVLLDEVIDSIKLGNEISLDTLSAIEENEKTFLGILDDNLQMELMGVVAQQEKLDNLQQVSNFALVITSSLSIATVAIVSILIFNSFVKPLSHLEGKIHEVADGNLEVKIEASSDDEMGYIASEFEKMRLKVKLKRESLEEEIESKTKELYNIKKVLDEFIMIAKTNPEGEIIYTNKKFREISQYAEEELLGNDHRILKSNHHPKAFFHELWQTISSGNVWKGEIKNKAKDGSYYWTASLISPILDKENKIKEYIAIRTDITQQKSHEEQLKKALDEMKQVEREKEEFTAMISHELKTPITPIMMWVDALKEPGMLGNLNKEQKKAVDKISSSADQLKELIDDMFDAYKLDLNRLYFEYDSFPVEKLMEDVIESLQASAKKKNIALKNSTIELITMNSDEYRITQVLKNLINNAMDFVAKGSGEIEINATEENNFVVFSVKDNGVGISKENQEKLFQKFYQIDKSYTRRHSGSGLGLAISKGIVDGLGGKIWVDSEVNVGTTFYFELPKNPDKKEKALEDSRPITN